MGMSTKTQSELSNDNVPVFLQQSSFACGTAL